MKTSLLNDRQVRPAEFSTWAGARRYHERHGHDLGLDATPNCCDDEMEGENTEAGGREYTCGDCGIELTVRPNGLVADIYEPA